MSDRTSAAHGSGPSALEAEIRRHADAGAWADAAKIALLGYGPELLGLLRSIAFEDAEDLFAELCERLWRALPQFAWRSSFRTWAFTVARHVAIDRGRQRQVRARRELPLSDTFARQIADVVRSTIERTPASADPRLELMRALLDERERMLLELRVVRHLQWAEIAQILEEDDDVARATVRLRKQFARIRDRLRRGAAERR